MVRDYSIKIELVELIKTTYATAYVAKYSNNKNTELNFLFFKEIF